MRVSAGAPRVVRWSRGTGGGDVVMRRRDHRSGVGAASLCRLRANSSSLIRVAGEVATLAWLGWVSSLGICDERIGMMASEGCARRLMCYRWWSFGRRERL